MAFPDPSPSSCFSQRAESRKGLKQTRAELAQGYRSGYSIACATLSLKPPYLAAPMSHMIARLRQTTTQVPKLRGPCVRQ